MHTIYQHHITASHTIKLQSGCSNHQQRRKFYSLALILTAFCCLLALCTANAKPSSSKPSTTANFSHDTPLQGSYISFGGGMNLVSGQNQHLSWPQTIDSGYAINTQLSYRLHQSPWQFASSLLILNNHQFQPRHSHFKQWALVGGADYHLILSTRLQPYLGMGIGMVGSAYQQPLTTNDHDHSKQHHIALAMSGDGGLSYAFYPGWKLLVQYQLLANFHPIKDKSSAVLFNNAIVFMLGRKL